MSSDSELVRAAQGGDTTSFGILLERHHAMLYTMALPKLPRSK